MASGGDSEILLNALLNTVGSDINRYPEYVAKLLRSLPLDLSNVPHEEICKTLKSVNLIIDVLGCNNDAGYSVCVSSAVEDVFQCLRDILDQMPHLAIFNTAIDLLRAICNLCGRGGVESCAKFYLYNVHLIQQDYSEDKLKIRLRVISTILETIGRCESEVVESFRDACRAECETFLESIFFEKLILTSSDAISAQVLLTIVPHFVACFDATSALLTVWNEALNDASDPSNDAKRFSSLCYLFDVFSKNEAAGEMDLLVRQLQDEKFWKVLQSGLVHRENMIRRQALYLMKRSVAEMFDKDLTVNSCVMNELNGANFVEKLDGGLIKLSNGLKNFAICNNKVFMVSTGQESVMWWHPVLKQELSNLFNDLFLVFETLEEKQAHIVKPVFQTMIRLLGPSLCPFRNGKRLHVSWILVLFERILDHDNSAVVRWGLINITEIDMSLYQAPLLQRTILGLFVAHLNNPSVFVNEIEVMSAEIRRYFESAAAYPQAARSFFRILIEEITSATWSPETLFIVLNALHGIKVHSLETSHLLLVRKFVSTSIATHYTFLRAAIQCHLLHVVINLTDVSQVCLNTLADVLSAFRGGECLQRGCSTWEAVVKWIEYCFSKKNAEEFIIDNVPYFQNNSLDISKTSRMVCLLYDAHLFGVMKCCGEEPSQHVLAVLSGIFKSFKDVDKRLYADQAVFSYNLGLVCGILRETLAGPAPSRSHLVDIAIPHFPDMLAYITSRSDKLSASADYSQAQLYVEMVELILKGQKLYKVNSEPTVTGLLNYSMASLGMVDSQESTSLIKYVSLQYLKLILHYVYHDATIPRLKTLQSYFKNKVNVCLDRPDDDSSLWGRINSGYLEAQWSVMGQLKSENILTVGQKIKVEPFLTPSNLAQLAISALDLASGPVILAVMSVVDDILPDLEGDLAEQVVQACWTNVWDRRRSDAFATASRKFISMLFQPEVIRKTSNLSLLQVYSNLLLTESVNGLANSYLTHVQTLGVKYSPCELWEETLGAALIFGGAARREDKLTQQVSAVIASISSCSANQLVNNDWNTSGEVRARALQVVLTLSKEKHSDFADRIVDALLANETQANASKSRSFAGSPVHLIRTRVLQALLVIEPLITKQKSVFLYNWLCALLLRESHQPSVRYTAEWLLVRILWRNEELQSTLWANFSEALEQRIGSLCSFISVVFHTTSVVPECAIMAWLDRAMLQFLPYCLAQHFSLRLYAQVAIEKMWHIAEAQGLQQILDKYRIIRDCQLRTIGNAGVIRNAEKLRQDFYWTIFHPLRHFSLQTIFRDLPRLAHIKSEEWITPELLTKVNVPTSVTFPVPWSSGDELWVHPVSNWTVRNEETSLEVPSDNLQKKLIPVKSLLPDYESMLDESVSTYFRKQQVHTDGLVVVASLVDRAANIGGLCRTCEAFGVSQLVIDSLQVLEDKQFQSLSVTSEKWVHITEVKSHYLSDYLLRMKSDGYSIVGAEQTSRSVSLQSVVLPRKCILLLGSEKEGLPPPLLALLDVCVEIPQFGVIRSLNVHVTGALFVWEYVKQHTIVQK